VTLVSCILEGTGSHQGQNTELSVSVGLTLKSLLCEGSIYLSIYLSIYISEVHLLDLRRLFSFLILYTVGRTPWTGDQPVASLLPTHRTTQTRNKRTQTSMPWMGFEPTIPAFERAKTVFMPQTARPPCSTVTITRIIKLETQYYCHRKETELWGRAADWKWQVRNQSPFRDEDEGVSPLKEVTVLSFEHSTERCETRHRACMFRATYPVQIETIVKPANWERLQLIRNRISFVSDKLPQPVAIY
jgi:hypothetical protein